MTNRRLWIRDPSVLLDPMLDFSDNIAVANSAMKLLIVFALLYFAFVCYGGGVVLFIAFILIICCTCLVGKSRQVREGLREARYEKISLEPTKFTEPNEIPTYQDRIPGRDAVEDIAANRPEFNLSSVGLSTDNKLYRDFDRCDRNNPYCENFATYPFDERLYRKIDNRGSASSRGLYTKNYPVASGAEIVNRHEVRPNPFKRGGKLVPVNQSSSMVAFALDQNKDYNSGSGFGMIHDRENAYFQDNYTRNRLRVAIGESNRTSGGYQVAMPQETRTISRVPEKNYLDSMGIYE